MIKEGNLKRYLLYAIGEILLVMVGISLAFQLDNWNENRIKENTEINYYKNIKDQIDDDKTLIIEQLEYNNLYMSQFKYANEVLDANDRSKMDTLGHIIRNLTQYSDFDRKGNIHETLVNSGEIKLLKNNTIVNRIRMLEEKYNYVNRMENIHYDAIMSHVIQAINPVIKFSNGKIQKPDEIYNYKFQNLVLSILQVMIEKDKVYHEVLYEIEFTINLINEELVIN
ncbi:hypothetical protein CLV91_1780 [Maribacter vaceletii]|uniref:Uncharacterized protein n=2 Tax=Maribacter vaceletii TaxID=1206816 RepID=A0A495E8D0_9FLAO|nr:hypothetical protein CLV91_1780 [Maribacter vaceletii]